MHIYSVCFLQYLLQRCNILMYLLLSSESHSCDWVGDMGQENKIDISTGTFGCDGSIIIT